MTKKYAAGESGLVGVLVVGVFVFVVSVVVLVVVVVVPFDDAADAEPETNTASVTPSENVASVVATTTAALRRGAGLLTTDLPCRSPGPPGSRSLAGADRVGLRSHCGPPGPPGLRSSPTGRRRKVAGRRRRRRPGPPCR